MRLTLALAATLTAVLTAVAVVPAATKPLPPKLIAKVGPDSSFKITLTKGGKKVTKLKPGEYRFVVYDTATIHNFHLTGPGKLSKATGVAAKSTTPVTWKLTLKKGTYHYVCDPHATLMKGSFTVG